MDPAVTDPWQPLETPTRPPAALALSFPGGGARPRPKTKPPWGVPPPTPWGSTALSNLGPAASMNTTRTPPIWGPVEGSPTPVVVPGLGVSEQGSVPLPAILHTPGRAGTQGARAGMEATPSLPARRDQAGTTIDPGTTGAPHAPLLGINTHGAAYAPGAHMVVGLGRDAPPASTLYGGVARVDGGRRPHQLDALPLGLFRQVSPTGAPGEHRHPGCPDTAGQAPAEGGRGTATPWNSRRIQN